MGRTITEPRHRLNESGGKVERRRFLAAARALPWLMALFFGSVWMLFYYGLGLLHRMWPMFNREFPFLLSSLLGVHHGQMSPFAGGVFAFADGALVGGVLGWAFAWLVGRQ